MEEPTYTSVNDPNGNAPPFWSDSQHSQLEAVESFRRKLKFFFMNPCEKYKARGRKPWKLLLQIIKTAIITIQLVSFGLSNQMVVTFKEENLMTFRHLFLKGYTDGSANTYAVYSQKDMYDHIGYVIEQFADLQNISVGNHAYEKTGLAYTPLVLCQQSYRNGSILPGNETFDIDAGVDVECVEIYPAAPFQQTPINKYPANLTLDFKRLLAVNINFTLKAINLQTVQNHELPDCYDFDIMITFNNKAHSGRIKVDLDQNVEIKECKDWNVTGTSPRNLLYIIFFDTIIILTCLTSLILCSRSVVSGIKLQFEYTNFFATCYDKTVPWSDRMEFINGWYFLIIVSDSLTIIGSIIKIEIQIKDVTSYDICSILLGTGTMLVWIGGLRYMGYFRKYNILILTLRAAFPNVIRFCCCAAMIYLGYCFCGWIVLGPYHEKFRTLNTVSECLFSLINGDDMFPTFKDMQVKSYMVWLYSRIYLYTFVSLFIYMVLSLFITLITDTYETIKHQQQDGSPGSELHAFMSECKDSPDSGHYRKDKKRTNCLLCCLPQCRSNDYQERLQN
ncbi:mucolipin-3 isoform X2 [Clupea harengus]|nr:mucolipin-3 isoform X2 [Clupea harengus]XP_031430159.1 mucolipin-3 isoform X2 [Clupea harengus]